MLFKKDQYQKYIGIIHLVIDENIRDSEVKEVLHSNDIIFESFDDQIVYAPGKIKTKEDKPYSVFTPFKRRWIENFDIDFLDIEFKYSPKNNSDNKFKC